MFFCSFVEDFRRRFVKLQSGPFKHISLKLTHQILNTTRTSLPEDISTKPSVTETNDAIKRLHSLLFNTANGFSLQDLKRLDAYSRNLVDFHLVLDLVPTMAVTYYIVADDDSMSLLNSTSNSFPSLTSLQEVILVAAGLKGLPLESVAGEFDLPMSQVLALFNKLAKKMTVFLKQVLENKTRSDLAEAKNISTGNSQRKTKASAENAGLSLFEVQELEGDMYLDKQENGIGKERDIDSVVQQAEKDKSLHKRKQQHKFGNRKRRHKR